MTAVEGVICDFGGVLTSPMRDGFSAFELSSGISAEQLGTAMGKVWERQGLNPLFELETGRITEAAFLAAIEEELTPLLGREARLESFGETFFEHLHPNERTIDYMRSLQTRGYRMAICTNNVREWEPRWRAMLPVEEIFSVVVDSAFVGLRKPEPEIYALTLERLGVEAPAALFVDDIELNCDAAREAGMRAVWFRSTEQAIEEIEAALAAG